MSEPHPPSEVATFSSQAERICTELHMVGARFNQECAKLVNVKSAAEFERIRGAVDGFLTEFENSINRAHDNLDTLVSQYGRSTNDETVLSFQGHLQAIYLEALTGSVASWTSLYNTLSNDESIDKEKMEPMRHWIKRNTK